MLSGLKSNQAPVVPLGFFKQTGEKLLQRNAVNINRHALKISLGAALHTVSACHSLRPQIFRINNGNHRTDQVVLPDEIFEKLRGFGGKTVSPVMRQQVVANFQFRLAVYFLG